MANDDGQEYLKRAARLVESMQRGMTRRMSALRATVFLKVALDEGQTVNGIARDLDAATSTVARHLLDMGEVDRNGGPGYRLVEVRKDPLHPLLLRYFLTAKGKELVADIASAVDGRAGQKGR